MKQTIKLVTNSLSLKEQNIAIVTAYQPRKDAILNKSNSRLLCAHLLKQKSSVISIVGSCDKRSDLGKSASEISFFIAADKSINQDIDLSETLFQVARRYNQSALFLKERLKSAQVFKILEGDNYQPQILTMEENNIFEQSNLESVMGLLIGKRVDLQAIEQIPQPDHNFGRWALSARLANEW